MTEYSFATAQHTLLPQERARVFFDGIFATPRLSHPEGVAIGPDGWIWCGNQDGELLRIDPTGSTIELVASTDGFCLGLAFAGDHSCFVCDLRNVCVWRFDLSSKKLERWQVDGLRIPNYPVVDSSRGRLYVSDSHAAGTPGPGVWSFDLASGDGHLWYSQPMNFANGMALNADGSQLYVCETFARKITRIEIKADGSAGTEEIFADDLPGLPDGIAFDKEGNLVVGCYEPSRLLRISPDASSVDVLVEEPTAHVFCHPTNIAFATDKLYTANLGRWHISCVDMDIGAPPLWRSTLT